MVSYVKWNMDINDTDTRVHRDELCLDRVQWSEHEYTQKRDGCLNFANLHQTPHIPDWKVPVRYCIAHLQPNRTLQRTWVARLGDNQGNHQRGCQYPSSLGHWTLCTLGWIRAHQRDRRPPPRLGSPRTQSTSDWKLGHQQHLNVWQYAHVRVGYVHRLGIGIERNISRRTMCGEVMFITGGFLSGLMKTRMSESLFKIYRYDFTALKAHTNESKRVGHPAVA